MADPRFVAGSSDDFRLLSNSPAVAAGRFGQNLGAFVSSDILVWGEPKAITGQTQAELQVGGPGIFAFRYRINQGPWSEVRAITDQFDPIGMTRLATVSLPNLSPGRYQVDVLGQDFAGNWQREPTRSRSWAVVAATGDLNDDGTMDAMDVNTLCRAVVQHDSSPALDLNRDGDITREDVRQLVEDIFATSFGDTNLDGQFDSSDLVLVLQRGEFEDTVPANSDWIDGDWNCDGDFSTEDLVFVFQRGGYRQQ